MATRAENEAIIRQVAAQEGIDGDLLVAIAIKEVGEALSETNPGDGGASDGVFQEHNGGRGAGLTNAQKRDVAAATRRAAAEVKATIARNPRADPGTIAVLAQRPREDLRPAYAAQVNQLYAGFKQSAGQQRPPAGAAGAAGAAQAAGGPVGAAGAAAGQLLKLFWPVVGQTPGKLLPGGEYGAKQAYSAGMSRDIGSVNDGVNIPAKYGQAVVAITDGVVLEVNSGFGDSQRGGRNADDGGGWGNNVLIRHADGKERRYAHLAAGTLQLKPGQVVAGGTRLGAAGDSGNAIGVHVDIEQNGGAEDLMQTFRPGARPVMVAGWQSGSTTQPMGAPGGRTAPGTSGTPAGGTTVAAPTTPAAPTPPPAKSKRVRGTNPNDVLLTRAQAKVATAQAALDAIEAERQRLRDKVQGPPGPPGSASALAHEEAQADYDAKEAAYADPGTPEGKTLAAAQKAFNDANDEVAAAQGSQTNWNNEQDAADQAYNDKPPAKTPDPTIRDAGPGEVPDQWNPETGTWEKAPGLSASPGTPPTRFTGPDGVEYTFDPATGKAKRLDGVGAEITVITDPVSGDMHVQNPDGSKGKLVFRGKGPPINEHTARGRVVGIDSLSGEKRYETDTLTPEERDRLERTEEGATQSAEGAGVSAVAKGEADKLALELLKQAGVEIDAALALPEGVERTNALQAAMEKYQALSDPAKALEYVTKQADTRIARAHALALETGWQHDPLTLQPVVGPDGQPVPTADVAAKNADREATFQTTLAAHARENEQLRNDRQETAQTATSDYSVNGLATAPFQQNLVAATAPVQGMEAAAKSIGADPHSPVFQQVFAAMQKSGALGPDGMPQLPKAPQRADLQSTFAPQAQGQLPGQRPPTPEQTAMQQPGVVKTRRETEDGPDGRKTTTVKEEPPKQPAAPPAPAPMAPPPPAPAPRPKQPVRGKEAVDIGGGMARTEYDDGSFEDWRIPEGGGGGGGPLHQMVQAFSGYAPQVSQLQQRSMGGGGGTGGYPLHGGGGTPPPSFGPGGTVRSVPPPADFGAQAPLRPMLAAATTPPARPIDGLIQAAGGGQRPLVGRYKR